MVLCGKTKSHVMLLHTAPFSSHQVRPVSLFMPLLLTLIIKGKKFNSKLPANFTSHKLLEYPVFSNDMHRSPRLSREVFVTAIQGDTPTACDQQHTDVALYRPNYACTLHHLLAPPTLQTQVR